MYNLGQYDRFKRGIGNALFRLLFIAYKELTWTLYITQTSAHTVCKHSIGAVSG